MLFELIKDGRGAAAKAAAACFAIAWTVSFARGYDPPGNGPSEDRHPQIARGTSLRLARARALTITPCAFEHFALIAAFSAPESVDVKKAEGSVPTENECPKVEVQR